MAEQGNERDSGFSIDDILHEQKKSNPIKRSNTSTSSNYDVDPKKDKQFDGDANSREFLIPYNETHYPSRVEVEVEGEAESEITNRNFGVPKFSEPTQDNSNPNAGFGIAQLLSSKDSFLAKSIVVHDNKSNLSQKGMTFLEKLTANKNEEKDDDDEIKEDDAPTSSNFTECVDTINDEEKDPKSNLFLSTAMDHQLPTIDQSQMTGEENERRLVDATCKLFLFDKETNSWKSIGSVTLHVNEYVPKEDDPSDKFYTRIIARSLSLQRPILNFKLWPNIVIDLPSENTILMQASYMNDVENIRFISLSMKPPLAHEVWKVIKEKSEELNNFLSKKAMISEYRETYDDHEDLDDEELYDLISDKQCHHTGRKIKLLDSKKTFQPNDSSNDEADEDDEDDNDTSNSEATPSPSEGIEEQPNAVRDSNHTDEISSNESTDSLPQEILVNGSRLAIGNPYGIITDEVDEEDDDDDEDEGEEDDDNEEDDDDDNDENEEDDEEEGDNEESSTVGNEEEITIEQTQSNNESNSPPPPPPESAETHENKPTSPK